MRRTTLVACVIVGLAACGDNIHPPGAGESIDTVAPSQVQAGDVLSITCNLTQNGQTAPTALATIDVVDADAVSRVAGDIIARKVGTITVTCTIPDDDLVDPTPALVEILPGPAATLVATLTPNPATAGDTVVASCEAFDSSGNELDAQSPTLTITPSDPGNTITGLSALMTRAGHYDGECALAGATSNDVGFDVVPNLPATLVLGKQPDQPFYPLDTDIAITDVVADRYGNEIANALVTVTSTPVTGTGPTTSPAPSTFSYGGEGKYEIDGVVTGSTDGGQPVTASTDIFIDSLGPKVVCGNPGDGTMIVIADGGTATFQGMATDVNGTASVAINGTNVAVGSNGSFSGPVTTRFGINFVHVTATDTFNVPNTKICTFLASSSYANPNIPLGGAIGLSLAQGAIDDGNRSGAINSLGDLLSTILNSQGIRTTIDASLKAENPLVPNTCEGVIVFGDCVGFRYSVTYLGSSIAGPNNVALTLVTNGIATTAVLEGIQLQLQIGGTFSTTGTVDISSITVGLTLVPAVSGGVPHVTVTGVTASVGSISTNFSGLTGDVLDLIASLAQNTLKNEVQNLVQNYVTNNFGAAIDGVVSGLNISSLASEFSVPRLYGGGTIPLDFGIAFSSLDTTPARLHFGIGTFFTSTLANALATLGVAVPPGTVLGDPNPSPGDTAAAVNVVVFNQVLHALWRANYFTATIMATSINATAPPDLAITLSSRLPPVADIRTDGTIELSLGDVDLALTGAGLPPGLVITIGGRAHATVAINGTTLSFGAISLDDTEVSLDALGISSASQQQLQQLIASALPQLVSGALSNSLPSLPIPSFPIPASLAQFGLPAGSTLSIMSPTLQALSPELILRGSLGIQ